MAYIKTYPLQSSNILRINAEKDNINAKPEYQRRGELWNIDKRQLLIDSILNDYDIPKIYFHMLTKNQKQDSCMEKDYAIIDGRQRIETIWSFIQGDFPLAKDFKYLKDSSIKADGLSYPELALKYPKLKILFDSFQLPIVLVETDDLELIEDMFSRLNEAVPLNAAEKRNSIGGPMAKAIREVAKNQFFKNKVKISDKRYQHKEIAARLLFVEYSLKVHNKIIDTKKWYLDSFVHTYKSKKRTDESELKDCVHSILNIMNNTFTSKDPLLNSQAIVLIYYLLFKSALKRNLLSEISRQKLLEFNSIRYKNRKIAEKDITGAEFDWLEFDRLNQQGTNDASSIKERLRIIEEYFKFY